MGWQRFLSSPWPVWPACLYLCTALACILIQLQPAWREALIYDRVAVQAGQFWRIWSAHWVHFGWQHLIVDVFLWLLIGATLGRRYATATAVTLITLPIFVGVVLFWWDTSFDRYGGLSAMNLGLLLLLAARTWQGSLRDWIWPAIVLLYVVELGFEIFQGGQGGGLVRFDDPEARVATNAHLAGVAYALTAWLILKLRERADRAT